jgi:hypothetical protein
MFTHIITQGWSEGGQSLSKTISNTANAEDNRSVNVYPGGENAFISFSLDVAALQSFFMVCTVPVVVTPHDQENNPLTAIDLQANVPFVWVQQGGIANPFDTNIGSLVVDNPGAAIGQFDLRCLVNSTPAENVGS